MPNFINLENRRFGSWKVIEKTFVKNGKWYWLCECDCGKIKNVNGGSLTRGLSTNCGCIAAIKTGNRSRKHGGRGTRLYSIWKGMRKRCNNPRERSFKNYGGRGIVICNQWSDFSVFREWALSNGYSEKLTIDRIDNNGNYEPSNCRWTTLKVQAGNTRKNRFIIINGESKTLTEWSKVAKISPSNIFERLKRGITGMELLKPTDFYKTKKFVVVDGTKYSVSDLAKMAGVKRETIYKRLQYGFTGKKLLKSI